MKTILVTGSTDGIGKLAAAKFAKDGHEVLLHGRNSEKLHKTIAEISELSNNKNIKGYVSDLSNFDSIENMITNIKADYDSIDVLLNNAGVFKSHTQVNDSGLDLRFAVNYFAPYIITNQLLPLLKKSKSPRVINLSSAAQSSVNFEALAGHVLLSSQEAYAQSKLALTMLSFYLAEKNNTVNVIAVNPGSLLNTKMAREVYGQYWSSADKGADILYELAISEAFNNSSGSYFDNDKGMFSKAHPDAYNQQLVSKLISETNKILGS